MTQDIQQIKLDRMRYTKATLSSNLILLAIVFDCLYFISLYKSDVGSYYYNWAIGASIVYNLLFLLAGFLASEGVKSRNGGYTGILIFIGLMQFVRMTFLPSRAYHATVEASGVAVQVMDGGQYTYVLVCLAVSGVCCLVAAFTSARNTKLLAAYMSTIDTNVERVD